MPRCVPWGMLMDKTVFRIVLELLFRERSSFVLAEDRFVSHRQSFRRCSRFRLAPWLRAGQISLDKRTPSEGSGGRRIRSGWRPPRTGSPAGREADAVEAQAPTASWPFGGPLASFIEVGKPCVPKGRRPECHPRLHRCTSRRAWRRSGPSSLPAPSRVQILMIDAFEKQLAAQIALETLEVRDAAVEIPERHRTCRNTVRKAGVSALGSAL
jgi:hypothetical protein